MANKVILEFAGDARSLQRATRTAGRETQTLGQRVKAQAGSFTSLGGAAGALPGLLGPAGAAIAGIGAAAFSAAQAASSFQDKVSGAASIVGADMRTLADQAKSFRFIPPSVAAEAQQQFAVVAKAMGLTGGDAVKLTGSLLKQAEAMSVVTGIPIEEVTVGISAAFRGEYDSLQRLIPGINAAAVQTEALRMTGKASAAQLTEQEKAQAALNLINQSGAEYLRNLAANTDTAAAKQKELRADIDRAKVSLGEKFLPVLAWGVDLMIDLVDAATKAGKAIAGIRQALDRFENAVGGVISAPFRAMFRAEGGPVRAGSPYVVGERGPELFVPGSSGRIVPGAGPGGRPAGAGSLVINIGGSVVTEGDLVRTITSGQSRSRRLGWST